MAQRKKKYAHTSASKIPKGAISWLVGNHHCGESDREIAKSFIKRVKKSNPNTSPGFRKKVVRYALKIHHANRQMFCKVNSGI